MIFTILQINREIRPPSLNSGWLILEESKGHSYKTVGTDHGSPPGTFHHTRFGVTRSPSFQSPTPRPFPAFASCLVSVTLWASGARPLGSWGHVFCLCLSTKAASRGPPACSWPIPLQSLYERSLHTPAYRQKPLYLPTAVSVPILVRIYLSGLSERSLKEWGSSDAPHKFSGAGA